MHNCIILTLTHTLTEGSIGPLIEPVNVILTDCLQKGANIIKGSRKYPILRCAPQEYSTVPPSNTPGW